MSLKPDISPVEAVTIDVMLQTFRLVSLAGAASLGNIKASLRSTGWRDDEVLRALKILEEWKVIQSKSDRDGTLAIVIPGPDWPLPVVKFRGRGED